jgi:hypothetical protein
LGFLERFYCTDDRAVGVSHDDCAHANPNLVTRFVVHKPARLSRLCRLHGSRHWALLGAILASRLIAMQQSFRDARMTDDFVSEVSGNALRAITPDQYFLVCVDDADTHRKHF